MKYWIYPNPDEEVYSKLKLFLVLEEVLRLNEEGDVDLTERTYSALCKAQIFTLEKVVKLIDEIKRE